MDSNISNTPQNPNFAAYNEEKKHSFIREHNAKLTTVIPGYRHSVVRYRVITAKQQQGEVKPTKLVTVPQIELPSYFTAQFAEIVAAPMFGATEEFNKLSAITLATLEDAQDSMIKETVDSGKVSTVEWSDITLDKVISFLTTARAGARLTREIVEAWAMSDAMQDAIKLRASELHLSKTANGATGDGKTLEVRTAELSNRYKTLLGGLSAAVPTLKQNESEACESLLKRSNIDDDISRSLLKKLNEMLRPKITESGEL